MVHQLRLVVTLLCVALCVGDSDCEKRTVTPGVHATCSQHEGSAARRHSMLQSNVLQQPRQADHILEHPQQMPAVDSGTAILENDALRAARRSPLYERLVPSTNSDASDASVERSRKQMAAQFAHDFKTIDDLRAELASDAATFHELRSSDLSRPLIRESFPGELPRRNSLDKASTSVGSSSVRPAHFRTELEPLALVADSSSSAEVAPELLLRPHKKDGVPEKVVFDIYVSRFYGADMKAMTFTIDNSMTLRWEDAKAAALVPSGSDSVTLSDKEAQAKIWLPQIETTNRKIRSYELISTAVTIDSNGGVTKTERALVVIMNQYEVHAFPFDTQVLTQKIASSKYMLDELVLVPSEDRNFSGAPDDLCYGEGFKLQEWKTSAIEDKQGMLQKSRGLMTLTVQRTTERYIQEFLVPSFLLLFISWGVFWFPFMQPFITPRLALSILSLLSFTTMTLRIDGLLPPGAPFTWNDLYCQNVQWLQFFTVKLNIFTEIFCHTLKKAELAQTMNHELKAVWPLMAVSSFLITFSHTDGKGLESAAHLFKLVLVLECGCWYAFCALRYFSGDKDDVEVVPQTTSGGNPAPGADKKGQAAPADFPRSRNR